MTDMSPFEKLKRLFERKERARFDGRHDTVRDPEREYRDGLPCEPKTDTVLDLRVPKRYRTKARDLVPKKSMASD